MTVPMDDEKLKLIDATARWVFLKLEHEKDATPEKILATLYADAWHSSLLQRLLAGKEPLPVPPPTAYSYPWYSLIEEGEATLHESGVNFWGEVQPEHWGFAPGTKIVSICQSPWIIVKEDGLRFVVKYDDDNSLFLLEPGKAYVTNVIEGKKEVPGWKMTRVDPDKQDETNSK